VVAAASYEARAYGIHSAMPGRQAARRCPDAIFVPSRISYYAQVGRQVRTIFRRFTPLVQPLSLDEAFLDVSGTERLHGDAAAVGRSIQQAIRSELQLTASVGVAPLKFVAKIASALEKPGGFVCVAPNEVIDFLDPLPVQRLWGVGRVGQHRLEQLRLRTIGDLRRADPQWLTTRLDSWGQHLWRLANGIDPRAVVTDREAKQISHERTFAEDQRETELLRAVVCYLCEQTAMRLRRSERKAQVVGLKYRRDDFRTFSHSRTLETPTDRTRRIIETAVELLGELRGKQPRPVRLIGVSLSGLVARDVPTQLSLFDLPEQRQTDHRVDRVVDELDAKLGRQMIYRAGSHRWRRRR
jgi:DNA polymerase-4